MKLVIRGVKAVPGVVDQTGDVVLKFDAVTDQGPALLIFTATAADHLKRLLDTPAKSMRLGGKLAPE